MLFVTRMETTEIEFRRPPATRYQGSKLKLLPVLGRQFQQLEFETVLDAFSGTGCVAYLLKGLGKQVTCNDLLRSNQLTAQALVENSRNTLSASSIDAILSEDLQRNYGDLIARNFEGIYFTPAENHWLDIVAQNIPSLSNKYERSIAYYALFQACVAKRPYNLFHRRNLYMRTADVPRSFGNKATWDTPFEEHFRRFAAAANEAVFENVLPCRAECTDVFDVTGDFDLVYIDPPYVSGKGVGVDYRDFYHFLEGLADYSSWEAQIDHGRKHLPLIRTRSPWADPHAIHDAFAQLIAQFTDSTLVVSYRSDGIPGIDELVKMLRRHKSQVQEIPLGRYKYALSKNGKSQEVLLIAQ